MIIYKQERRHEKAPMPLDGDEGREPRKLPEKVISRPHLNLLLELLHFQNVPY
jgi:hypothetical protein